VSYLPASVNSSHLLAVNDLRWPLAPTANNTLSVNCDKHHTHTRDLHMTLTLALTQLEPRAPFSKTFSKDLPMSDDLGIPKKFSFPNSWRLSLHFQRSSSFLISVD